MAHHARSHEPCPDVKRSPHAGTAGCAIWEYDDAREQFYMHATDQLPDELVEALRAMPIRKGEGALGRLAVVGEPVEICDVVDEPVELLRLLRSWPRRRVEAASEDEVPRRRARDEPDQVAPRRRDRAQVLAVEVELEHQPAARAERPPNREVLPRPLLEPGRGVQLP